MLHNNYTQQDYKSYHVILAADPETHTGALLLGDLNAATDQKLMAQHCVKTIITAASGLQHLQISSQQTHIVFPLLDLKNQNIESYFQLSYHTIEENLKRGGVLVHCGAGISRSATLVIAYYMKKYNSTFGPALKFIRKIRPSVCPNLGFELQLKKYQEKLENQQIISKTAENREIQRQHRQQEHQSKQFEPKQMLLTFNAPITQAKTARIGSNAKTVNPVRKSNNYSSVKQNKVQEGDLFVIGRQTGGGMKNQSMYEPSKYWRKGGWAQKGSQNNSFKL